MTREQRGMVRELMEWLDAMGTREYDYVMDLADRDDDYVLSESQADWLESIYEKVCGDL